MFKNSPAFSGYAVDDIEAAKNFYKETLGLEVSQDWMGLKLSFPNGQRVFIYDKNDHTPATFTVLNLPVDTIETAVDTLRDKGVVFEHYDNMPAPQDDREILRGRSAQQGPDIAWFKDPAGNILSVLQE